MINNSIGLSEEYMSKSSYRQVLFLTEEENTPTEVLGLVLVGRGVVGGFCMVLLFWVFFT